LKLMIVDDEVLIGLDLVDILSEAGYECIGPFTSSKQALAAIESERVNGAVLDVNLGGQDSSVPIALKLSEQNVPFVFVSGYSQTSSEVMMAHPDAPVVSKPFDSALLKATLDRMFTNA
jgi:two-component SAPR family response regulator